MTFPSFDFLQKWDVFIAQSMVSFKSLAYYTGAGYGRTVGHTTLVRKLPKLNTTEFSYFINSTGINKVLLTDGNTFLFRFFKVYIKELVNNPSKSNYSLAIITAASLCESILLLISPKSILSSLVACIFRDGKELLVSPNNFLLNVHTNGVRNFDLLFDTAYFDTGSAISLLSLGFLVLLKKLL